MYDVRTDKCHVAIRIIVRQGGREEVVPSILCINKHFDDKDSGISHCTLILTGSFDESVAAMTIFSSERFLYHDYFQASRWTTTHKLLTRHGKTLLRIINQNTILDTTSK